MYDAVLAGKKLIKGAQMLVATHSIRRKEQARNVAGEISRLVRVVHHGHNMNILDSTLLHETHMKLIRN